MTAKKSTRRKPTAREVAAWGKKFEAAAQRRIVTEPKHDYVKSGLPHVFTELYELKEQYKNIQQQVTELHLLMKSIADALQTNDKEYLKMIRTARLLKILENEK